MLRPIATISLTVSARSRSRGGGDVAARPCSAWLAYGPSKLANLLFTSELQRRLAAAGSPIKAHAAHPGYSATNLQGHTGNPAGTRFWTMANTLTGTSAEYGANPSRVRSTVD